MERLHPLLLKSCVGLIALGMAGPGCIFGSSSGSSSADEDTDGETPSFRECRDDASEAEITDTIAIVDAYNESLHEMVACGGLSVTLCTAIVSGIIDAIISQNDDATPDGWVYQGDGVYYTNSAMAEMSARFYLAEDFTFGNTGDVVTPNLFLVESYLVNASVVVNDPLAGSAELRFDGPGPLVELLGFGPNPTSPIEVSINDLTTITGKLKALQFDSEITIDDARDNGTIRYDLTTTQMPANALIEGSPMGFNVEMATGSRADLGQSLVVDDWAIEFVNGSPGALDGTIDFHVDGDHFGFAGTMVYENSTYADPALRCP